MQKRQKTNKAEYIKFITDKTRKKGSQLAIIGIPCIAFLTIIDFISYPNQMTLCFRLGILTILILFLALSQRKQLKSQTILILHLIVLLTIMVMACGITIIEFSSHQGVLIYVMAKAAIRLQATAMLIYIFAAGLRQYLHFFLAVLTIFYIIYIGITQKLDWLTFSLLVNPIVMILALLCYNRSLTRQQLRDFARFRLVSYEKNRLTTEIYRQKQQVSKLHFEATRDELTNLYNRRVALTLLEQHLATTHLSQKSITVCFIDVDQLKQINDTNGHIAGDNLLRQVAKSLQVNIRNSDYICRLGGDEFLLIFPACDQETARTIVKKIQQNLIANYQIDFSYGFATYKATDEQDSMDAQALIDAADRDMYVNKITKKQLVIPNSDTHKRKDN
ncbi:MAG: diguanylate cyclase [Bacillota bacterium]|jgi:diguanylate cyclase (GGDEF)-like protein